MTTTQLRQDTTAELASERNWRLIGAVGMILGVASFIVTTIVQWTLQPTSPSSTVVDVVIQYPHDWLLVSVLAVLGPLVWVAGIGAVTSLVRARGWVLTTLGGTGDLAASGVGSGSVEAVQRADDSSVIGTLLLLLFLAGFSLGPILLTIGLRRAKLVAVWVPVAAIVMVVANFVGGIPAGAVQLVAMLLAFGPLVFVLLQRRGRAVHA